MKRVPSGETTAMILASAVCGTCPRDEVDREYLEENRHFLASPAVRLRDRPDSEAGLIAMIRDILLPRIKSPRRG